MPVHSYACIDACVFVCICACLYVCVCKRPHNSPISSLTSPPLLCTHKRYLPKCLHPAPPNLGPSTQTLPTWDQLPPRGSQTRQTQGTRGGAGRRERKAELGRCVCLFAWHAFVSDCFIHPLSQPESSQFNLPSQRDQIGGMYAHPQKPDVDFQLSFNFAPVFICSFHFFQMDWRGKSCNLWSLKSAGRSSVFTCRMGLDLRLVPEAYSPPPLGESAASERPQSPYCPTSGSDSL